MTAFQYHPTLVERFPTIVGGVILADGLTNGETPVELGEIYTNEQEAVEQRIGTTPLSQIPSLAAWRKAFRAFDVDPTQYRSAAEALLRRLTKKGHIPTINTLVDLGNLVSIRYALPVAVFDTRLLSGAVTVRFASGDEQYTSLGQSDEDPPIPGEVIFADDAGTVIARRWCWRQSEPSAAQMDTTNAIITIEGHHAEARRDIEAALQALQTLLHTYARGTYKTGIVDKDNLTISQ
jgi:DNA/RNA-binding domain of Phe-tRNA-synthetase-like protein